MTNKLRSVIEGITKWRDFFPIDYQDAVPVIPYEDAKQAQVDLLDAIIEEMEKDYRTDSGKGGIVMCLTSTPLPL